MIQLICTTFSLLLSISFIQMSHPLAMGLTLLVQTILICLITGMMSKTFWFSYILFLIFLGGMLVLFIYVTSLASNEMFSFSTKILFSFLVFISFSLSMGMILFLLSSPLEYSIDMVKMTNNVLSEEMLNMMKLYNFPSFSILMLLVIYLLITLVVCVKITNLFYGPLRKMF